MDPAVLENTVILQFKIKITGIPHEKLTNTVILQTPMSPSSLATKRPEKVAEIKAELKTTTLMEA